MEQAAANEFDGWATDGHAESMERGHAAPTEALLSNWALGPESVVLDVGCGNGWALRRCHALGAGGGLGIDISPQMVASARARSAGTPLRFEVSSAQAVPLADGAASHVLSVENLYYLPDPAAALREWARACRAGGRLSIMVDLYAEAPLAGAWVAALPIEVHVLSEAELAELCRAAGWTDVRTRRFPDPRPPRSEAEFEPNEWSPSYALYLESKRVGSLLIEARRGS